jgi:hypothetical protein
MLEIFGEKRLVGSVLLSIAVHALVLLMRWHGGGDTLQSWQPHFDGKAAAPLLQVSLDRSVKTAASVLTIPGAGIERTLSAEIGPMANQKTVAIALVPVPALETPALTGQIITPRKGLGIIAESYRRPSELTEAPYPLTVGAMDFSDQQVGPAGARFAVEVFINEAGGVDEAEITHGLAPPILRERAKQVFGETRYKPGLWHAKPVKSRILIEVYLPPKTELPVTQ